jgi:hypothetical protein
MDLLRHRILLLPLLLFAVLFLIDKIFFIRAVRDRVLLYKKIEPDMYDSRRDLLDQLIARYPEHRREGRRVGIILGSSRSAEFSTIEVQKVLPDTATYNFSVPMGGMAHAFYYADLLKRRGIRPDYMVVEADLINFGSPSLSFAIQYDFDPRFVLEHTDFFHPDDPESGGFRPDETDTFFLKYFFALYRYPVNPRNIIENYSMIGNTGKRNIEFRWFRQALTDISNREHLGGIPNPLQLEADEEALLRDALMVRDRVLGDAKPSATQMIFFRKLLAHAKREGIPLIVYKPVVSDAFQKIIDESDHNFQSTIVRALAGGFLYVDPQAERPLQCRAFVDALHLSGNCYPELTRRIFAPLLPILEKP